MRPDILTVEGEYFDFISPDSPRFIVKSIAHTLSNICRFAGHAREFYSVVQHSVVVSRLVPTQHALAGLPYAGGSPAICRAHLWLNNVIDQAPDVAVLEGE